MVPADTAQATLLPEVRNLPGSLLLGLGSNRPHAGHYAVLAGTIVMSAIVPFHFVLPRSAGDAAMMASMGLIGALGHYCIARALAYADASLVSPFNYWQLIGAVILGYAMFGDLPDRWTWIGAAVIVGAGLLLAFGETRAARRRVSAPGR